MSRSLVNELVALVEEGRSLTLEDSLKPGGVIRLELKTNNGKVPSYAIEFYVEKRALKSLAASLQGPYLARTILTMRRQLTKKTEGILGL